MTERHSIYLHRFTASSQTSPTVIFNFRTCIDIPFIILNFFNNHCLINASVIYAICYL